PHAAVWLPPPLLYPFLNSRQELGIVLFDHIVEPGLRLLKPELRKFLHQREDGGERLGGFPDGLLHGPEPADVNMAMADNTYAGCGGPVLEAQHGRESLSCGGGS